VSGTGLAQYGARVQGYFGFNLPSTLAGDMKDSQFHHRLNADGTIDSICLNCFLTVASAAIGFDLHEREAVHQCYEKVIVSESLLKPERHET
jgi:hypothetical protein